MEKLGVNSSVWRAVGLYCERLNQNQTETRFSALFFFSLSNGLLASWLVIIGFSGHSGLPSFFFFFFTPCDYFVYFYAILFSFFYHGTVHNISIDKKIFYDISNAAIWESKMVD